MKGVAEAPATFDATEAPATAKLFMHGGSQAVRLPKAFRFDGKEVQIRKSGNAVVLEPVEARASPQTDEEWAAFWARIDALRGPELIPYPPRDDLVFEAEPD